LASEAGDLAAELEAQPEPRPPRLLADDATPEALAGLLAAHGRIAILAAESAFLDNLSGRYADGRANLHLVCQAYTGEPTTVDRRGSGAESLERPLLTVALCVQPHVLAHLAADPTARGQGLVARCLLARPRTLLGHRASAPPPVPETIQTAWSEVVERVAEHLDTMDKTSVQASSVHCVPTSPRTLTLTADALGLLDARDRAHEPRLREDGDLRPIASWMARDAGRAIRVTALLHLAAATPGDRINAEALRAGVAIADWSLAHALAVLTGPDADLTRALEWLSRQTRPTVTVRELHRGLYQNGATGTADDARRLADRLEAHGALRAQSNAPAGPGAGRPPSPSFAVHPDLYARDR